jgi:hypothetical protein
MGTINDNARAAPASCNASNGRAQGDDIQDDDARCEVGLGRSPTPTK